MPFYEVHHVVPLTAAQQDELADAITTIHSTHMTTPRMFVNVRFVDGRDAVMYIGGRRRNGNFVWANVRAGPSRTPAHWEALCRAVVAAWDRIVPMPKVKRSAPDPDFSLRGCIILGSLTAGYEAGYMVPPAGGDVEWLHEHWDEFNAHADAGDEDFVELVRDVKERGLVKGANGATAA